MYLHRKRLTSTVARNTSTPCYPKMAAGGDVKQVYGLFKLLIPETRLNFTTTKKHLIASERHYQSDKVERPRKCGILFHCIADNFKWRNPIIPLYRFLILLEQDRSFETNFPKFTYRPSCLFLCLNLKTFLLT